MGFYIASKTFGENGELSTCYREWQSTTGTQYLHGYTLKFRCVFECHFLDDSQRTISDDVLDPIRQWFIDTFGQTVCVAEDDPELAQWQQLDAKQLIRLRVLPSVSLESFAQVAYTKIMVWLVDNGYITRVTIRSVECFKHDDDSALFVE